MKDHFHTKLPSGRDIPFLTLGLIGIGTSGPIIAKSLIPVPSLIFLRNLIGGLVILPFALSKGEWKTDEQKSALRWAALSGAFLAAHFLCFFGAMRLTSVATGTAIAATQPIFAAIFVKFNGGHIPHRSIGGMVIAFLSVILITGVDFNISIRSFQGDLLALIGGIFGAAYMLIGAKVQKSVSTATFTSVCYLSCAIVSLPVVILSNSKLIGFSAYDIALLIALILGAQLLGHTMFNASLKRVSPVVVSLIVFFEVPVSAFFAYIWLGQQPPVGTIPGIIGLLFGCALFVVKSSQETHQLK